MKILVFGGSGMLGHKLVQQLSPYHDVRFTLHGTFADIERFEFFIRENAIENVDVAHPATIRRAVEAAAPDVVINAVGVIKQLPTSHDVITALTVNSIFPHRLAELAAGSGFRFITVSTDCVFDGARGDYAESDEPDARDLYGKSKSLGEVLADHCLTLRTSIIGRELGTTHSLIEWFLSNQGQTVKGFANAIYSGFPTIVFAGIIKDLIERQPSLSGLYHVSSEPIKKYDLLCLVREKFGVEITIDKDESFRVDRSLNSQRFRQETEFSPPSWHEMITALAEDPTPYDKWK